MYQQMVCNEYGEPMYVENVMDAQEEQEFYFEEMQMRADDPYYAQMREQEEWCARARAAFESQGIQVPQDMVNILAREMRRKQMEIEEKKALDEVQPVVDFLNKHFPDVFVARYEWPTPEECGYAYVDFKDWTNRPYRDEVEPLIPLAMEQGIYIEDYLSMRELKKREQQTK
jgi:hypothetical protein